LPSFQYRYDVDAEDDEVEIVPSFAFDFERLELAAQCSKVSPKI
jgi:hypothetical protein